jgi:ethanolamine ammonia-lyase small subunit
MSEMKRTMEQPANAVVQDPWASLRDYTAARIALGRTGSSLPLKPSLEFRLAHACARQAVYSLMEVERLVGEVEALSLSVAVLHSQAHDRAAYLQRPDQGRALDEASRQLLHAQESADGYDIAFVVADGLSATAININAIPLLKHTLATMKGDGWRVAPVVIVQQGRVAVGDEVGELLKARLVVMLIGERPGLSSTDSLGIYLTFEPRVGRTDESRNCISNVRPTGLPVEAAAGKLVYLVREAFRLKLSGVNLKDSSTVHPFLDT